MRALIDTNVIMDALADREPYNKTGKLVIKLCGRNDVDGVLAAHSLTNLFYLLRKYFSLDELRNILLNLCDIFAVEGIDRDKIVSALNVHVLLRMNFAGCFQSSARAQSQPRRLAGGAYYYGFCICEL